MLFSLDISGLSHFPLGRGLPLSKPLPGRLDEVIEMHHDFFKGVLLHLMLASFFVACLIFACPRMRASEEAKMVQNEAFQSLLDGPGGAETTVFCVVFCTSLVLVLPEA